MRPPDQKAMEPWVQRSYRAHLNLLEQLLPFATIVFIAHLTKVSTPTTVWCSIVFFWLRVALHRYDFCRRAISCAALAVRLGVAGYASDRLENHHACCAYVMPHRSRPAIR
jgi:MAPEG family